MYEVLKYTKLASYTTAQHLANNEQIIHIEANYSQPQNPFQSKSSNVSHIADLFCPTNKSVEKFKQRGIDNNVLFSWKHNY